MPRVPKVETGVGRVVIAGAVLYGRWEYRYDLAQTEGVAARRERQSWTVRVGLDEYERLGIHPYQRVTLQVGSGQPMTCYFKSQSDYPPWVVLTFDLMQRGGGGRVQISPPPTNCSTRLLQPGATCLIVVSPAAFARVGWWRPRRFRAPTRAGRTP